MKKENPLTKAYFAFDQFLVDRANEAVKAWNWTTGRTRAELADVLNVSGWVTADLSFKSGFMKALAFPISCYVVLRDHKEYKITDENDRRAINGETMIFPKEIITRGLKGRGLFAGGASAFGVAIEDPLYSSGFLAICASNYIMRADYQAPRKDCVRRGIEKLSEMAKLKPALETSPVINYSLEDMSGI